MPLILKIYTIIYFQFKVLVKTGKFFICKLLLIINIFHGSGRNCFISYFKDLTVNT